MNDLAVQTENIPQLLDRAAGALASAKTSGEVLEAKTLAQVAYDAAKSAGRIAKAKKAHDDVIGAVYRAQADAALIEARAKMRLADEYDAAQERGEVGQRTGRPKNVPDGNDIPSAEDIGLSRKEIHEARQLRDAERAEPGVIERTVNERVESNQEPTKAAIREAAEQVTRPHVANNSGNNEWYTPPEIIEAAREVIYGDFDLDPASSEKANERIRAKKFYTKEMNGLDLPWEGNIWVNPPYASDLIGKFVDKYLEEIESIQSAFWLVNNATETTWFQNIASVSQAICFPLRRIRFLDPEGKPGAPLQGQAIIYRGDDQVAFVDYFREFGVCVSIE